MASGQSLLGFEARDNISPKWLYVEFTSGSTEPTADGDGTAVIWGDSSDANAVLEYLVLTGGSWAGNDAAGYMLLSNWDGTAWTADENFTADTSTAGDHGTLTGVPVLCAAIPDVRNSVPVLDFDATVNELAMFQGVMPSEYAGTVGLTFTMKIMSSTPTGDMSFKMFLKRIENDVTDIDVANFAAPQSNAAMDAPAATGNMKNYDIPFTDGAQMDNIAVGEKFFLLVMRDAQDATNDDMAGDAELVGIEMKET
jgi:hypothetical protein